MQQLEQQKRVLEAELKQIEAGLNESVNDTKEKILSAVVPRTAIRKNPFKSVAVSVLVGFVAGLPKVRRRRIGKRGSSDAPAAGHNHGFTSLVLDELKRIAARRAVQFMVDSFDENISKVKEK